MSEDFPLNPQSNNLINFSPFTKEISTQEELINRISEYFDAINKSRRAPTFSGLALTLNISRAKLRDLPKDNPFTPIIEKAKQYIVDYMEQQLSEPKSSAGVAFWLKNNDDWQDKTDLNITSHKSMKDILDEIDQNNHSPLEFIDAEVVQSL